MMRGGWREAGREARPATRGGACGPRKREMSAVARQAQRYTAGGARAPRKQGKAAESLVMGLRGGGKDGTVWRAGRPVLL